MSEVAISPQDEADVCNFLSRVSTLQRLCSDADERYPCGLLFVPGPDGRYNKGSVNILKYLFHGATGKYLLDGTIEEEFEDLEESILLIQQSSVSIFWNTPAKKLIGPLIRKIPFLIEYSPTAEEEDDVDRFQMRKCIDFKRMILEAVPEGRGIGIPIPLGYDELNEIEGWPILQAFAMDSVLCPTGFFTARYVVADITEYVDVMFRAVDGFTVGNIVHVLRKSIVPHMNQMLDILDTVTADQRARLSAEDVLGPLEMLFDFGELECAFPCDPAKKPKLLIGSDTSKISESSQSDPEKSIGDSSHVVVEACEPSCGLRWCRTYFLSYGKIIPFLPAHLVAQYEESEDNTDSASNTRASSRFTSSSSTMFQGIDNDVKQSIHRLQLMYHTLVVSLKAVVMYAFANNVDVFEAGTFIQDTMDDLLKGKTSKEINSTAFFKELIPSIDRLRTGEWLQLHMDCMNALGEVIGIEDVDDMGGSCLMYIRASIHGINLPDGQSGSVAVGDTFLFSVNSGRLLDAKAAVNSTEIIGKSTSLSLHPFVGDCFCLTHILPYFRVYVGNGVEESSAQRLLSFSRNPHILASLGLGKTIEVLSVGTLSVPILTDNRAIPYFLNSDIRVFSEGFIIEKLDATCLPMLISTNIHIAEMWIVDAGEALSQSLQFAPARDKYENLPDFYSPNGNLMVFRLRKFESDSNGKSSFVDGDTAQFDEQDLSIRQALHGNPVSNAMPYQDDCEYLAMFIPTGSRSAQILTQCTSMWRSVLHASDVPIHRGADSELPSCILISYLTLLEKWSYNCEEAFLNTVLDERSPLSHESFVSIIESCGSKPSFNSLSSRVPALGFLPLKCVHAFSESLRMRPNASPSASSSEADKTEGGGVSSCVKGDLIIVSGLPGSGVISVGYQIYDRLKSHATLKAASVVYHYLDVSLYAALDAPSSDKSDLYQYILTSLRNENSIVKSGREKGHVVHVVVLLQSPVFHAQQTTLINTISKILDVKIGPTITVLSPKCFNLVKPSISLLSEGAETDIGKFGDEVWRAAHTELCQASLTSIAIFIDGNQGGNTDMWKAWMANNSPSVTMIRLNPLLLRLEDDFFEELIDGLSIKERKVRLDTSIESIRVARGVIDASDDTNSTPLVYFRKSSVGVVNVDPIQHICVRPSSSNSFWELSNLVRSLLLVFPNANVNSMSVQNTWSVPELAAQSDGKYSWWQRCIQLARVKALTNLRISKGRELYDTWCSSFVTSQAKQLQRLRDKTYSIHGFCRISKGEIVKSSGPNTAKESSVPSKMSSRSMSGNSSIWLHVEANVGNIIIKVVENKEKNSLFPSTLPLDTIGSDALIVTGLLNKVDIDLLDSIFAATEHVSLSTVPLISLSDVTREQRFIIQDEAANLPLGGAIWFDGTSFIDVHGNRREFRPDIDALVEAYVRTKNKSLSAYNDLIIECEEYI